MDIPILIRCKNCSTIMEKNNKNNHGKQCRSCYNQSKRKDTSSKSSHSGKYSKGNINKSNQKNKTDYYIENSKFSILNSDISISKNTDISSITENDSNDIDFKKMGDILEKLGNKFLCETIKSDDSEITALIESNDKLNNYITILKVELSEKDKVINELKIKDTRKTKEFDKINELTKIIDKQSKQIEEYCTELEDKYEEIDELRRIVEINNDELDNKSEKINNRDYEINLKTKQIEEQSRKIIKMLEKIRVLTISSLSDELITEPEENTISKTAVDLMYDRSVPIYLK